MPCGAVHVQVARMVSKYFQEQQQKELKAERDDAQKLKRIAGSMAKMVREFWANIEKVDPSFHPRRHHHCHLSSSSPSCL